MSMQRLPIPFLGGALFWALLMPSAVAADLPQGVDPKEWAAFNAAAERFHDRAEELHADVVAEVETTKAQEMQRIESTYSAEVKRMQADQAAKRKVAIARMDAYITKYKSESSVKDIPDVMYRLADLYIDESDIEFLTSSEAYEVFLRDHPDAPPPEEPKRDLGRSMALYREIIERYPSSDFVPEAMSNLAYYLDTNTTKQYDREAARDLSLEVVRRFPNTIYSDEANMRLGEYYFEQVGPRENPTAPVQTAMGYYQMVFQRGPEGRFYDKAMYKLGWSYYKLRDYTHSLDFFVRLMNLNQQMKDTGQGESDFYIETLFYLAVSYTEIADVTAAQGQARSPIDIAAAHLHSVKDPPWSHEVIEKLADTLLLQAKFDESIVVLRYLQDHWPNDEHNPLYQYKISQIIGGNSVEIAGTNGPKTVSGMPVRNEQGAVAEMRMLAQRYADGSPWYIANKDNPDAIAKARAYIENSLKETAYDYLVLAQNSESAGNPDASQQYRVAAQKLGEFLDQFPFSSEYDDYQWYYAYALFKSDQFELAQVEFKKILKNDRSKYRDGARYLQMTCREAAVIAAYSAQVKDPNDAIVVLPSDAIIEQTLTLPSGKTITLYKVGDLQSTLITTYDDLSQRQFNDPEWIPSLEAVRAKLVYLPGAILFNHGRYDEARTRYLAYIQAYPKTDLALNAAIGVVDSYRNEANLDLVAQYTTQFLAADIGATPKLKNDFRVALSDVQEKAIFNIANRFADEGKFLEAGNAFLDFIRQYPTSPFIKEALYNGAFYMGKGGQTLTANKLFEQYTQTYPADPLSQPLYFKIAQDYSQVLELEKAIAYYDRYLQNFPNAENAADALFNASFLRVGIGDHLNAARGYERYASDYPERQDAEATYWGAGEQWELVSDAQALDFYQRYLKRYPNTDANHVIKAWSRIALIYDHRGDVRRATAARVEIQSVFAANTATVNIESRHIAALQPVQQLQQRVDALKKIKFTTDDRQNVELLKQMQAELGAIETEALRMGGFYADFDSIMAAYYLMGLAQLNYADQVYAIPIPREIQSDDEQKDAYLVYIDEQVRIPAEDKARKRLNDGLALAADQKKWSEWNTKAKELLHDRFPFDYPGERPESRGTLNIADMPLGGPVKVPEPEQVLLPPAPTPAPEGGAQ